MAFIDFSGADLVSPLHMSFGRQKPSAPCPANRALLWCRLLAKGFVPRSLGNAIRNVAVQSISVRRIPAIIGRDEQIFGADEQVPGRQRRHLRSIRLYAMQQGGKSRIYFDPFCQLAPALNGRGLFVPMGFFGHLHFLDNQRSVKWLTHLSRSAPLKSGPGEIDLTPLRGRRGTETRTS